MFQYMNSSAKADKFLLTVGFVVFFCEMLKYFMHQIYVSLFSYRDIYSQTKYYSPISIHTYRNILSFRLVEHNRPFISQNYLEQLNRERKHQCYKHCIIRFCIGGKVKLQAAFQSSEPGKIIFIYKLSV